MAAGSVAVASGTTDVQGVAGTRILMGYSVIESAGTPAVATVILRNGTATTDPAVVYIELAANGGETMWFGPQGITFSNGIFVDRTGEASIVLFTG